MLTALQLGKAGWRAVAGNAGWQMTRMNLNTFLRHEVFDDHNVTRKIAQRLASAEQVQRARVFPYQLLMAYKQADPKLPRIIREALQDAMEAAIANAPRQAMPGSEPAQLRRAKIERMKAGGVAA